MSRTCTTIPLLAYSRARALEKKSIYTLVAPYTAIRPAGNRLPPEDTLTMAPFSLHSHQRAEQRKQDPPSSEAFQTQNHEHNIQKCTIIANCITCMYNRHASPKNTKSNMESVVNCTPDCAYEMKATQHPCTPSMPNTHSLTSSAFQEGQCVTSSSRQQCCKPLCSICPRQKHKHISHTTCQELRRLQGASLTCCTACMNQHWLLSTICRG